MILVYIYIYIYIYIYMYICMYVCGEKLKNKVIQSGEFNMKENRPYDISVLINHYPL